MSYTTDPNDARLGHGTDAEPQPQNEVYLILSDEERAKGFVRPVRQSYVHVGRMIKMEGTLRPLTDEEKERYSKQNYAAYMKYPESRSPIDGMFLTQTEVDNLNKRVGGCGTLTTMSLPLAETYARNPKFYGATYCTGCQKHLPVNEFQWDKTTEEVGL